MEVLLCVKLSWLLGAFQFERGGPDSDGSGAGTQEPATIELEHFCSPLRLASIPKDDLRIVILKNFIPNETRAAVATRVDGQWLILDNRTLTLVRDADVTRAIPEFVLDHEGVKRFNRASQKRRVSS